MLSKSLSIYEISYSNKNSFGTGGLIYNIFLLGIIPGSVNEVRLKNVNVDINRLAINNGNIGCTLIQIKGPASKKNANVINIIEVQVKIK